MPDKSNLLAGSRKAGADRPPKPYPEFPLGAHASGHWCKKIRGQIRYFGRWGHRVNGKLVRLPGDGWQEALALYKEQVDDLKAGRTPRVRGDRLTVADLCNHFRTAKQRQCEAGEITPRTLSEYVATTDRLVATFGGRRLVDDLAAEDFESLRDAMAKLWGPVRLGNEVQKARTVFKYGYEAGLIEKPMRFGPQFKKPTASVLRRHKAVSGPRMIEADELRRLLDLSPVPLKAMILLGVNCGLGNHDIAMLPLSALDVDKCWLSFPRPKTGIDRRCPLWVETAAALKDAIAARPAHKSNDAAERVFLTVRGRPWLSRGIANPVSVAARKLFKAAGIAREGVGFYTLRHVFRTIADGARDQVAVNHIMGHVDGSMGAVYRERIDDARLLAVVKHVHDWLWPIVANPKPTRIPKRGSSAGNDRATKGRSATEHATIDEFSGSASSRLRIFA